MEWVCSQGLWSADEGKWNEHAHRGRGQQMKESKMSMLTGQGVAGEGCPFDLIAAF